MTERASDLRQMFTLEKGRVYLTGVQALVRLAITQRARDERAGLNTAGFFSGYRGSPLGGVDQVLWRMKEELTGRDITFLPAINEEHAATALIGTQLVPTYPGHTRDGVFGIWYGKGPGLDRAADALKHAAHLGASRLGGFLAVVGDDHGAKSSSLAHQSEQAFASFMMPVLHPASVAEYIDFGLLGIALSRYSGCAVGFKALTETVESAVSMDVDMHGLKIVEPDGDTEDVEADNRMLMPLEVEKRLHEVGLKKALAFARANRIDRVALENENATLGLVTVGKSHMDTMQALRDLGIDENRARDMGIRIYKVGMPWPLEPEGIAEFAAGLDRICVIEEKRGVIEGQLRDLLYSRLEETRPKVIGKIDERGEDMIPTYGELNPAILAPILAKRVLGIEEERAAKRRLEFLERKEEALEVPPPAMRPPYFCSGCPHNTSTRVPEGSRALVGTGCHLMAAFMERDTDVFVHMGAEGVPWAGMAPYLDTGHVFQNLGDGTLVHSGTLAIRQMVASNVNMTYKILYNDAVAMTGGQPLEGGPSVPQITHQLYAEGIRKIAFVSNEPGKYGPDADWAKGVTIHHRDELDAVQRDMRDTPGVTAIVYDQTCAAELRRRRKRGQIPDPDQRVFINDLVCEGCGDCNVKSNCLSVEPLETEWGRKRWINQTSCNKDYSCLNGFCPSFVSVHGARLKSAPAAASERLDAAIERLPEPELPDCTDPWGVLVTGIGGTGVVTIGQVIGMAAHLDGKAVSVIDFTGLAQKGGAVLSHLRIAADPAQRFAARLPSGGADVVIGGDLVVSAGAEARNGYRHGHTVAVMNSHVIPTADTVLHPDADIPVAEERAMITADLGAENVHFVDANTIADRLAGQSMVANMFLTGFAWQLGKLPVGLEALREAIAINGVDVELNRKALDWGRLAAHDPEAIEDVGGLFDAPAADIAESLDEIIARRADFLRGYQNDAWAQRYLDRIDRVRAADAGILPDRETLTESVARALFKLMSYKDEYEVARLHADPAFKEKLDSVFEDGYRVNFHLAAPLISPRDKTTGHLKKRRYGEWMWPVFRLLSRLKGLRGTMFDPFGWTAERRMERRLIRDYERLIDEILPVLEPDNYALAVELAQLPLEMRGFGHIKDANVEKARAREEDLRTRLFDPAEAPAAAE